MLAAESMTVKIRNRIKVEIFDTINIDLNKEHIVGGDGRNYGGNKDIEGEKFCQDNSYTILLYR